MDSNAEENHNTCEHTTAALADPTTGTEVAAGAASTTDAATAREGDAFTVLAGDWAIALGRAGEATTAAAGDAASLATGAAFWKKAAMPGPGAGFSFFAEVSLSLPSFLADMETGNPHEMTNKPKMARRVPLP
jgi:hypothetical protein